jgi:aspartyl-tRNA(Asn)/glutamyl-tRNA(Gln) amidotransferase subunit A
MFEQCIEAFNGRGARVIAVDDPVDFEQVLEDHRRVMAAEAAAVHSAWLDEFPDDYPPRITELIREGQSISAPEYLRAKAEQERVKTALMSLLVSEEYDAAVTPAIIGAPPDPSTTGDPAFNSPWSFCGLPTVSFLFGLDIDYLPLALQVVGRDLRDSDLLRTAEWCQNNILYYKYDQLDS